MSGDEVECPCCHGMGVFLFADPMGRLIDSEKCRECGGQGSVLGPIEVPC